MTKPDHNSERPIWARWPRGLVWFLGLLTADIQRWLRCFVHGHSWEVIQREDGEATKVECVKCNSLRHKYVPGGAWPYGYEEGADE